ncbi:multidrug ABC transporter ATP-binding protein [Asanoa ishikariensis]|uniref:Simple sugar transport system ATP-binding protein n=1 Tax=Asanoa ishikariensis TaxID=137265 RepID=A0A1H3S3V5_9ACTN|nr:sugar ABC transporter ATP-binding protein [Asanoa ishikariensis]GIF66550.1 multidrug ABC transporter ATP-binding protein [Asanoa ishikariensis]SDZ32288.1 simple sugar transport system ATP-binding protein [Asanoa ishikariensis]
MTDVLTDAAGGGAAAPHPAVSAHEITKRFGATTALSEVSVAIQAGTTHALVGRNGAGKSTLVSVLTGLHRADEGTVSFGDSPAPAPSDRDGWRRHVACVYQRSTIIPALSVAENLFLNRQAAGGLIKWGGLRKRAGALLEEYGVDVDPGALAGDLNVEQRQLVEIARALSLGTRFIILDEPTARLDATAIERLFGRMRTLAAAGVTMLFISHHLREVYEVCDTVTVLRDARWVLTEPVSAVSHDALVAAMTGEAVGLTEVAPRSVPDAPPVLSLRSLTLADAYTEIDLDIRPGEMVGVTGSGSSGKVSLAETVGGLRRADSGTVSVGGAAVGSGVPLALKAGIGLVPEDRHREGLVPLLSVAENATLPIGDRLGPAGVVVPRRRTSVAEEMIRRYDIRTESAAAPVASLSGGNAQKVVLARALSTDPRVLVLINPTAGVDVRSKESLLGAVRSAADQGTGVLMVSDELDDLRHCDRVLVMFHGRVTATLSRGWDDAQVVAAVEGVSSEGASS